MKRVLITGSGSYVGTHVMERLREEPDKLKFKSWMLRVTTGSNLILRVLIAFFTLRE